jgi:hypothetical protein
MKIKKSLLDISIIGNLMKKDLMKKSRGLSMS